MKLKMYRVILLISAVFVFSGTKGQINTEKFRKHNNEKGFIFNTNFRMGYSSGNSSYTTSNGVFRVDYNGNKNDVFLVASYDYRETNTEMVSHKGFVHLRGIHKLNSKIAMEAFVQEEFNEFILIKDRKIFGGGARIQLFDFKSKNDTLTGLKSNFGVGGMFEHEVYNVADQENPEIVLNPFRITSYLTLDWAISNRVSCWAICYYQPNVSKFSDFRSIVETGMEIWIIGKLYFTFDLSYRYNNEPVGDVKKYDVLLKNGLRFSFP